MFFLSSVYTLNPCTVSPKPVLSKLNKNTKNLELKLPVILKKKTLEKGVFYLQRYFFLTRKSTRTKLTTKEFFVFNLRQFFLILFLSNGVTYMVPLYKGIPHSCPVSLTQAPKNAEFCLAPKNSEFVKNKEQKQNLDLKIST